MDEREEMSREDRARKYFKKSIKLITLDGKTLNDDLLEWCVYFGSAFAGWEIKLQALQFNDAIPAMQEAYKHGTKDAIAKRDAEIAAELERITNGSSCEVNGLIQGLRNGQFRRVSKEIK